ncbi:hypothetical protein N9R79_09170 [Vibrio sp.]|nr:hypothetical protein [Vibrio sp.]
MISVLDHRFECDMSVFGQLSEADWSPWFSGDENQLETYVHRLHDFNINVGCGSLKEYLVNAPGKNTKGELTREVYSNA